MDSSLESSLYFLERDPLYEIEKPYELNYELPVGQPNTNMKVRKAENIVITDIRGRENNFSFEENGFTLMQFDYIMKPQDFEDTSLIVQKYLPYVAATVQHTLGAQRVQIFDYTIRKRHEMFPISTGGFYEFKQPSSIVHVDTTPTQTDLLLQEINPREADQLMKQRYQYVNIWKPLQGPVLDWSLALCDPTTVAASDYEARDIVRSDSFMETYQIYRHQSHQWYFISNQTAQEAWLFLQSDSDPQGLKGVPHSAFPNPKQSVNNKYLRESIEVRALVFYGESHDNFDVVVDQKQLYLPTIFASAQGHADHKECVNKATKSYSTCEIQRNRQNLATLFNYKVLFLSQYAYRQ